MDPGQRLIESLQRQDVLKSPLLLEAFRRIDRADFILSESKRECYNDNPLPILCGQTISQPYTVAFMLELLEMARGLKILDIGSGSGWTTALLACITAEGGSVTGVERHSELVNFGRRNLGRYPFGWAQIIPAGPELGLPGQLFDRILVSAAARTFPFRLTDQLNERGILVIPVGHSLWKVQKRGDRFVKETFFGFSFVPLIQ